MSISKGGVLWGHFKLETTTPLLREGISASHNLNLWNTVRRKGLFVGSDHFADLHSPYSILRTTPTLGKC